MIRKFQEHDTDALLSVWYNANKLAHPFLSENFIAAIKLKVRDIYLPNTETWVAEQGDNIIGFISLLHSEGERSEVGALFVEPDFIGKGFGRLLMDQAVSINPKLTLDVFKENHIGRRFYERYGFHQVKKYVFDPTGDMVLTLTLD